MSKEQVNPVWESMDLCQNCSMTEFDCLCGEVDSFFNDIRQMADSDERSGAEPSLECGACGLSPCECGEY